jgi:hypothetical protein
MADDFEARLQALEWLITRLAVADCLRSDDARAAAASHEVASSQLLGDLLRMAQERGSTDALMLAISEGAAARDDLAHQIIAEVDASLRELEVPPA